MTHPAVARRSSFVLGLILAVPLVGHTQDNETCLTCHGDAEAFEAGDVRLLVEADTYGSSIHGSMEMECIDCHADLSGTEDFPHCRLPRLPRGRRRGVREQYSRLREAARDDLLGAGSRCP